jgi:hypothetical protein
MWTAEFDSRYVTRINPKYHVYICVSCLMAAGYMRSSRLDNMDESNDSSSGHVCMTKGGQSYSYSVTKLLL